MEKKHQDVLIRLRQSIIDDVDIYNGIIVPLTTEFILREEDVNDIEQGKSKEEKARILLNLLPRYAVVDKNSINVLFLKKLNSSFLCK